MTTQAVLYVGSTDLAAYGLIVREVSGWRDGGDQKWRSATVLGRDGAVLLDPRPEVSPRDITIQGSVRAPNPSALVGVWDQIVALLYRNEVTIKLIDDTTRTLAVRMTKAELQGRPPQFLSRFADVTLTMTALDPYWTGASVTTGVTTNTALALGTAPSRPVVTLTSATNPTLTYRNAAGATVTTLSLTGSGNYVIDCDAMTITKSAVNAIADLSGGDFLLLDPKDGDFVAGSWPTLSVTGATASITYTKRYY
jgi:phage-related protein